METPPPKTNPAPGTGRNARIGIWFFAFYCVLYAGFMGITAFSFKTMGERVAGLNWAIIYGMGLIVAAFVLAVIYMFLCTASGEHGSTGTSEDQQ